VPRSDQEAAIDALSNRLGTGGLCRQRIECWLLRRPSPDSSLCSQPEVVLVVLVQRAGPLTESAVCSVAFDSSDFDLAEAAWRWITQSGPYDTVTILDQPEHGTACKLAVQGEGVSIPTS